MKDQDKTRDRLLQELADARQAVAALEGQLGRHDGQGESVSWNSPEQRAWLETLPDLPYAMDARGTFTYVGPQMANYGLDPEELVSRCFLDFVHPDDHANMADAFQRSISTGEEFPSEFRICIGDEKVYWFEDRGALQRDGSGKPVGVTGLLRDITDRKRNEELTRTQRDLAVALNAETNLEEALAICIETAMSVSGMDSAVIYLVDDEGGFRLVAHRGLSDDFLQKVKYLGPSSEQAALIKEGRSFCIQAEQAPPTVEEDCRLEGLKSIAVVPIFHEGRIIACMNAASHRLTELPATGWHELEAIAASLGSVIVRLRAEKKVAAEQQLLRKLLDLQERERKLISYEIHDGFMQDVVGSQMALEAVRARLASQDDPEPEELALVGRLLDRAISEARRMISELRPMIIDEQGIVEGIKYLAAEVGINGGPRIEFHHRVQFDRLDPILEGTIFRIVQEALHNAKRHSQSKTVQVRLEQTDVLRLEIRDDGVGFALDRVPEDRFGLRSIQERARLFGGHATIDTAPGAGTRVVVQLPVG